MAVGSAARTPSRRWKSTWLNRVITLTDGLATDGAAIGFDTGSLILSDRSELKLSVAHWDEGRLRVQVNYPTRHEITAHLATPPAISDHCQMQKAVTVPGGASLIVTGN